MHRSLLGLFFLFSLSACVSSKVFVNPSSESVDDILMKSHEKAAKLDWFTANLKGKAEYNNSRYPITAQLRMRKDSVIWISVSALLGLEAARIYLTPDSFKVINRLNSSYFIGEVSALSEQYNIPLSFQEIQNTLLACHSFGKKDNFSLQESDENYTLLAESDKTSYIFRLSNDYLPQEIISVMSDTSSVRLAYADFVNVENQWLPQYIDLEVITNKKSLTANFSYSKMLINRPKKIKFSIPSSYAPM